MSSGTLSVADDAELHLSSQVEVKPAAELQFGRNARLVITGDTSIQQNFDWDGHGAHPTTTEVNGGRLAIDAQFVNGNNNTYNGNLEVNNGTVQLDLSGEKWSHFGNTTLMDGVIEGDIRMSVEPGSIVSGHGRLSPWTLESPGTIEAQGGTLELSPSGAGITRLRLGGASGEGTVHALDGDILVTGGSAHVTGKLHVGDGRRFMVGLSSLIAAGTDEETPTSEIHMTGGRIEASNFQQHGLLTVNSAPATFDANVTFRATSENQLEDELILRQSAEVLASAEFAGSGRLVVAENAVMTAEPGAEIGVGVRNEGTFKLDDHGSVTVSEYSQLAEGTLLMRVKQPAAGQADQLFVDGVATLDGTLDMNFGIIEVPGGNRASFDLIVADRVENQFAIVPERYQGDALFADLIYHPDRVEFVMLRALPGDANGDGFFNSGDLVDVFQTGEYDDAFNNNSDWTEGDWNGDLDFDSSDLVLAFQLGGYEKGAAAMAAVPEPSSCLLSLVGLTTLLAASRSRR